MTIELPDLIRLYPPPWAVTMDGIKTAQGIWVMTASNVKLMQEICDLANYAAFKGVHLLVDSHAVHINMLRGGLPKLTPEQIGHLYHGDEALRIVDEVRRQNPDLFTQHDAHVAEYEHWQILKSRIGA